MSTEEDRGAATVEFALILCFVLLPLVWGIIDLGRMYNAQLTLTHASREAARTWALGGQVTAVQAVATASAVGVGEVDVSVTPCAFGEPTSVTLTASFVYMTPLLADVLPGPETITATGVMRCGG